MNAHHALLQIRWLLVIVVLAMAMPLHGALAQDADQSAGKAERSYEELKTKIDKLRTDLSSVAIENKELEAKRAELEALRTDALAAQADVKRPLDDATAQLKKLGDPPPAGKSEAESIADERKRLGDNVARLEAVSKQLGVLILEAGQLSTLAGERQRQNFVSRIFEGGRSVINPLLWYDGVAALPPFLTRLDALISSWRAFDRDKQSNSFWAVVAIFSTALIGIVALWLGWLRSTYIAPALDDDLRRIWRAFRVSIYSFVLFVFAAIALELFVEMPPRSERLVGAILDAIIVAATTLALLRGILRPGRPELRLVNLSNASAARGFQLTSIAVLLVGVGEIIEEIANITFLPVEFSIAWRAGAAIFLVVVMAAFLVVIRRASNADQDAEIPAGRVFYFDWTRYFFHTAWIVVLIAGLALLTGHIALAHYITTRTISTGGLVLFLVMAHHLIDALVRSGLQTDSIFGKFLRDTISLSDRAISRLGLLLSSVADIALVLLGAPLVLVQWTLTWVDFQSWLTAAFFGFKVGDITIEPASILLAVFVLVVGLLAARLFTTWLERRVLARTSIDSGVRNSIRTGANYAGILLAAGIALTSAGLDFSNLAIVVGALGVGIGFGLQSIVNNFVSGLILLAERPIKVGDWIAVTGGEGIVKRINVRSTEIETFDRCSVIVPNSSLISEPVSNWYHDELLGRAKVMVGVAYDSDPEQVEKILLECARGADHVVPFPEPTVLFRNFGNSSLDFELRAFIDDVGWVAFVASDLRFRIFKAFKEAGIEIPFPQQDIYVKALPESSVEVDTVKRPARKRR
ncbi:MAG: mechanosensitive ion channel domain-containing protein, partial [Aestuariivirgaceae bacterium]